MKFEEIEHLEKTTFSIVVQALRNYKDASATIFKEEVDHPQDIAEDITREAIESLGLSGVRERLYGKVDFKKAIYVFLPEPHLVALMVDAKAEKWNGNLTATIQMSQTSMRVRMKRGNRPTDEQGKLSMDIHRNNQVFHVVTIIVKFIYRENTDSNKLEKIILACIPSGKLQDLYNPSTQDTIWLAGRDAPSRSEDFRVRLNFRTLKEKSKWRVQEILLHDEAI